MTRVAGVWLSCVTLSVAIFGAGCDEQINREEFPRLEVNPNPVVLNAVPVGETTVKAVTLRNGGGSTLVVTSLDFSNSIDTREFDLEAPELPIRLAAEEEVNLQLRYSPRDEGADGGELLIESNDPERLVTRVPITTNFSAAELVVSPPRLEFVSADGLPVQQSVTLTNLGTVPVQLNSVLLGPDTDPEFVLVTPNEGLPSIGRGESFDVTVEYRPAGAATYEGTLLIRTDTEAYAEIPVPLRADQPSPEIAVTPPSVVFGAIDVMTESERVELLIENQGTAPLLLTGIEFNPVTPDPTANEQFRLYDVPEMAEDAPHIVAPGELLSIGVSYFPQIEGNHDTALLIRSNDEDEATVTVPLSGRVRVPCIQVIPGSLDFGLVALNIESAPANLQIANCGDIPVTVEEITINDAGFSWTPVDPMQGQAGVELPPLGTMPIQVSYTNNGLAEGERLDAILTVRNTSPETPSIEVPLRVIGGGAPTCDLRILPGRMDFGLVARGRNVTRELELVSRGTGDCEIRSQEVRPPPLFDIPGFDVRFFLTGPAPAGRIGPGAFEPLEVTYRPLAFNSDGAQLQVTYWDPFLMEERMATADLSGISGVSDIEVIPGSLDFGRVTAGECASMEERVTVYNTGIVNLCITDLYLDGPDCDEFLIVSRPRANQDGCILVTRNTPGEVRVVYEPTDLGPDECSLVFESDANDNPELRVPLAGEGTRDRRQTDIFEQTSGRTVDVLFVVDNSGSMGEEQDSLQDNFNAFIAGAQQFANEYQLGVITTDMDRENDQGRLQGNPRIMRRTPDVEAQFRETVEVGVNGAGEERGLKAAHAALSDPLSFDTGVACNGDGDCAAPDVCVEGFCGGFNRGFLREEAALEIIFVSDEDDFSPEPLNFFVDFFKNIKGFRNESLFHAHAIVGARNGRAANCDGAGGAADSGDRYVEVARRTNGDIFSICEDDFGRPLRELGNEAFGLPVQFFLSRPAIRNTIQVAVDGMRVEAGWQYDEDSNSVVFDIAPEPRQVIQVDYEAQCFERRGG